MKRALGVVIALAVLAGAVVGVAYYQNKRADNHDALLPAQAAVLQSPVCRSSFAGERVACQINTYLISRGLFAQSIHFNMHRAPGNEEITVDADCVRRLWLAGSYSCRATPAQTQTPNP